MKVHIANRVLSSLSSILSLGLLGICIWILTSLLIQQANQECSWEEHNLICKDPSPSSSSSGNPSMDDETQVIVINNDEIKKRTRRHSKILIEFDAMSTKFKTCIIICLSGVILGSLVQLVCSTVLICSPSYKIPSRSRRIIYVFFAIFVIFLVGISWPLAYKREYHHHQHAHQREDGDEGGDNDFHTMSTLSSAMMNFAKTFRWRKIATDLNLYYIGLFTEILFLFLYMVVSCCLLRCTDYEHYDI